MSRISFLAIALFAGLPPSSAKAETVIVCTIVADPATGDVVKQEGRCDTRATSASTFKIPISLMGFDAGILKDLHTPAFPFKQGYPDWIPSWRSTTDPAKWMKESVVWYSQQITTALGNDRFGSYVRAFRYGNQDVSGDPGKDNGLTRAWLSSSLEISPLEQVAFLRKVVRRELPVSTRAYEMTQALVDVGPQPGGWHVYGKTGSGPSRNADGTIARGRPWGWFVGWATKEDRTVVFARLTKDTTRPSAPPGPSARRAVLRDLFASPDSL
ncbi:class D beta-lactamase [Pseudochelatococcus sp. B33]